MDYAQARYYAHTQGRFTSVDPLAAPASVGNPQTFNRYTYALNSPANFTDPSGMLSMDMTSACGQFCRNSDTNGPQGSGGAFSGGGIEKTQEIPYQGYVRTWNAFVSALQEAFPQNAEIKVAQVVLYGGAKEDSPIIAKGSVAPFDYADNPENYILDVNQGGVDPESSVFSIGVTFRSSNTGDWVPNSLKIDVPANGRWKLTDIADIPAIRQDQGSDRFSIILNLRARDLAAPNKPIRLQVSAFYRSLYRQDGKAGIDRLSTTGRISLRLLIGKTTVREGP